MSADGPISSRLYEQRQMEALAARWDAKAAEWDAALADPLCHLNEDGAYERFLRELCRIVAERAAFCSRHGVVDAGCATGIVLARVIASFAWGVGIDISPGMIQQAQAKKLPNARFLVGDCFNLRALSEKAGAVVSRGVLLSHYGQPHAVALLRSARECLVPGGFLVCDFLNRASRNSYAHNPENKTFFDAEEIVALAGEAGFKEARVLGEKERRLRLLLAE